MSEWDNWMDEKVNKWISNYESSIDKLISWRINVVCKLQNICTSILKLGDQAIKHLVTI